LSSTPEKKTKIWQWASWLIVISYIWGEKTKRWWRSKEARHHVLHLGKKTKKWWWAREFEGKKNQETCSLPAFFNYLVCLHKICLRDEDELGGSSSSLATPKKPTSRFFFLGCRRRWRALHLSSSSVVILQGQ
jgi:hypothetical protein